MSDPLVAERTRPAGLLARWVLANSLGELAGLGGVALLAAALVPAVQRSLPGSVAAPLATAAVMVALGSLEGAVVGSAQAWALVGTGIPTRQWIQATVFGAVLAWALGMAPSTVLALAGPPGGAPSGAGPSPPVRLLLAAGLGLVAGPILAGLQLGVLRGHATRAWRWLLANSLGWGLGMPLVFLAVRNLALHGVTPPSVARSAGALALAGGVVGLVEGVFLVRLLPGGRPRPGPSNI
jgi:hypothetical protein